MLQGNYVELQFSRRSILDLVRTSLVLSYPPGNPILPPTGGVFPRADDGQVYLVSQTAFVTEPGAVALRRGREVGWGFEWSDYTENVENVVARRCEVTQRLRLDVARKVVLPDGTRQDVDLGVVEGTLLVVLRAFADSNVPFFSVDVAAFTVTTTGLPDAMVRSLQRDLPGSFGTVQSALPIGQVIRQTRPTIRNCGIAIAQDASALSLRIQVGASNSKYLLGEWTDFHAGLFGNRLVQPDGTTAQWGLLLSPAMVESLVVENVYEQLGAHEDEFRLISGVGVDWAPDGAQAKVTGRFTGDLLIPCRPRYEVSFSSRLSVTTQNRLSSDGHVSWDADDWDLIACETLAALSVGLVGGAVGLAFGGPLGMAVGAGAGFVVGFIGAAIFASAYTPDLSSASCTSDGSSFSCTRTLDLQLAFGGATLPVFLETAVAVDDGLMLRGTFTLPPIPALRHSLLEVDVDPFDYTALPVSCGNLLFAFAISTDDAAARNFTAAQATITLRLIDEDGTLRPVPQVSATRLSPDPAGVFPPTSFTVTPYPDRTVVTVRPALSAGNSVQYFLSPYGVSLSLQTVFGTKNVMIGPVAALTDERVQELRDAAMRKLNECLAKQNNLGARRGRFELEWLVDPPPDGREHDRLWQIGVLRLDPGDVIAAVDVEGRVLGDTVADEHGIARLAILTGSGPRYQHVTLVRRRGADLDRETDMRVKQTVLVDQGVLRVDGPVDAVETLRANHRRLVGVRTAKGDTLHDVTFPDSLRSLTALSGVGTGRVRGTVDAGRDVEDGPAGREMADRVAIPPLTVFLPAADDAAPDVAGPLATFYPVGNAVLVPSDGGLRCYVAGPSVTA